MALNQSTISCKEQPVQRQYHSCPTGTYAVTPHLFTVCHVGSWEGSQVALSYTISGCTQWCAVQMLQCCRYLRVTVMPNEPGEPALAVATIGQQRGRWQLGFGSAPWMVIKTHFLFAAFRFSPPETKRHAKRVFCILGLLNLPRKYKKKGIFFFLNKPARLSWC